MGKTWTKIRRSLRLIKVNRELLVFLAFLLVAIAFWFMQTFKEYTSTNVDFELRLTNVPHNIIITSKIPEKVNVNVSGRGYDIINYITKSTLRTIEIDFTTLTKEDGRILIDNTLWRRLLTNQLGRSLTFNSINPATLEVFYSTGEHRYVPIVFNGRAESDEKHVQCGVTIEPTFVDIYAPAYLFDTITTIYTERRVLTNLQDTTVMRLALSAPKGVKCVPDSVDVTVCVDLFTNKTLSVPIYSENVPQHEILRTFPLTVDVTFRVSSSMYNQVKSEDFVLCVDYNDIRPDDHQCAVIMRHCPDGVGNVKINPARVDVVIEHEER